MSSARRQDNGCCPLASDIEYTPESDRTGVREKGGTGEQTDGRTDGHRTVACALSARRGQRIRNNITTTVGAAVWRVTLNIRLCAVSKSLWLGRKTGQTERLFAVFNDVIDTPSDKTGQCQTAGG